MGFFDDIGDVLQGGSDIYTDIQDQVAQPLGLVKGDEEKAQQHALDSLKQLSAPTLANLTAEDYSKGIYNAPRTELYSVEPQGRNAQLAALQNLQEISNGQGLTAADRARLQQIANEENQQERGQREAINQNAQARGVGGSGLELASLLNSQQGSAQRANERGLGVADLAQRRALDAILASGNLGGNIRGQDYQAAQAQDIINRFNTDYQNRAGLATLQERQRINEINQRELPQQRYENELRRRQLISGADIAKGGAADARRAQFTNTLGSIAQAAATGMPPQFGQSGGGNMPSMSPQAFFDSAPTLGPVDYSYTPTRF